MQSPLLDCLALMTKVLPKRRQGVTTQSTIFSSNTSNVAIPVCSDSHREQITHCVGEMRSAWMLQQVVHSSHRASHSYTAQLIKLRAALHDVSSYLTAKTNCEINSANECSGKLLLFILRSIWNSLGEITSSVALNQATYTLINPLNQATHTLINPLNQATYTLINPLNPELNPICYLLALLGDHHFLLVSRIRVKSLTLRLLMSYIWSTHSWCF